MDSQRLGATDRLHHGAARGSDAGASEETHAAACDSGASECTTATRKQGSLLAARAALLLVGAGGDPDRRAVKVQRGDIIITMGRPRGGPAARRW